ncbi:MAG: alpha/beta fold hydrolase [Caulobacteraceae bacterium]|nr:MAG: alpha/beta fold hydrolase [Caulobacteraceae bacterium]
MTLHFERTGRGPPLLLVHGLGGSLRSWDTISAPLSQSRELILIDLPGHGRSPPVAGRQTIAAFADALTAFIEAEQLGAVDLVGSSVGARLVLELSRRGVGRHCVALDPGGFWRGWETTFFHITIPMLRRPLLFVLVADTVANFVLFVPVQLLTGGGPQSSTTLLMFEAYRTSYAFGSRNLGAAQVVLLTVIMLFFVLLQFRLLREEKDS